MIFLALTDNYGNLQVLLIETIYGLVKQNYWGEGDPEPPSFIVKWSEVPLIYKVGLVIAVSLRIHPSHK